MEDSEASCKSDDRNYNPVSNPQGHWEEKEENEKAEPETKRIEENQYEYQRGKDE
jgi:hypothetical protein